MPTAPYTLDQILSYRTLSRRVSDFKPRVDFLRTLFFGNRVETFSTEQVDWVVESGAREVAPFVRRNGPARFLGQTQERTVSVSPCNLKLGMNTEPWDLLFTRTPGQPIYVDGQSVQSQQMRRQIDLRLMRLEESIVHAEEYLAAMIGLRGSISYEDAQGDVFTHTLARPTACNITLATYWNDATPGNVEMWEDFRDVQAVFSDELATPATDAVLGEEAAAAWRKWVHNQSVNGQNAWVAQDAAVASSDVYSRGGVMYLGTYRGVRLWEYPRSLTVAGSSVPLVRPKYAEFISVPSVEMYSSMGYGAIADLSVAEGLFMGQRFSKSWIEPDPSCRKLILQSRPMPLLRKPNLVVSVKVVSG